MNLKPNTGQGITFAYYINDRIETEIYNGLILFNSLASSDSKPNDTANPITIQIDNDWYLSNQQITITGMAEPNEDLNIAVFPKSNGHEKFRYTKTDSAGSFSTNINWDEQRFTGSHTIEIVGSKHDEISSKDIMVVSLEQLRSRSIDVSPKRQLEMGVPPSDIVCHQVWKLVLKPDGKTPTCLEPPTALKLEKRGWTILHRTS